MARSSIRYGAGMAIFHDADGLAVAAALAQIVADPQNGAAETGQQVGQLQLQIPLEEAVQGGKGLVQQDGPGFRRQDAGQRHTLLLAAGELGGVFLLQALQLEAAELLGGVPLLFGAAAGADAALDVLGHGHVGEQGVLLEEVAYPPLLGRQVDMLVAVEQRLAVQHDAALVGGHDPGDALQGHALAAAGGTQQGHGALGRLELRAQGEAAQLLFDVHDQTHAVCLLPRPEAASRFFFSSMFTTSKITAEMPTFTSTHFRARASL